MSVILRTVVLRALSNVFMTFAWYAHPRNLKQPLRLDFLWAALCICGAVYFIFRGHPVA